jgi:2',3'-cyclic-nucleotide 2'-phosphodiesterase (5'-nucleotidase family)
LINKERERSQAVLLVDAGNFAPEAGAFEYWETTEFSYQMMAQLGYDVVTPGDRELVNGVAALKGLYGKHPKVQVVSANLKDKSGKLLFPASTVIERGGVRFGITGVTGASYYNFNITKGNQKKDEFTFGDSKDALKAAVADLRRRSDVVVALVHEGPGDVSRMLQDVKDIDVVVVGHNPGYMFNPDRVGSTLIVRSGTKGQYLSVLRLTMDASGKKILDYNGEGKPLDDTVAKEEKIETTVKSWEADKKKREDVSKREKAAGDALLQGTEKYVGAEMCARCHADIYSKWMETPHAHAFQTLVKEKKETDAECVKCHVVGFGEYSGYSLTASAGAKGDAETLAPVKLANVQCESCHGMGTFHGTEVMLKAPSEETCLNCHTGEFAKGFDYNKAKALVH